MYFDQQNTTTEREIEKGNQFSSNRLNFPGHTGERRGWYSRPKSLLLLACNICLVVAQPIRTWLGFFLPGITKLPSNSPVVQLHNATFPASVVAQIAFRSTGCFSSISSSSFHSWKWIVSTLCGRISSWLGLERGWKWDVNGVKFPKGLLNLFDMKIARLMFIRSELQSVFLFKRKSSVVVCKNTNTRFFYLSISLDISVKRGGSHAFSHQSSHSFSLHFS